jgi:hypothetical protein
LTEEGRLIPSNTFMKAVLVAISEDTGEALWRKDLGDGYRVNPPAATNGKVYVTATDCCDTYLWTFDQGTGTLLHTTSMRVLLHVSSAPTLFNDAVYVNSGLVKDAQHPYTSVWRSMTKVGTVTSETVWQARVPSVDGWDGWTPAVDATHAYAYVGKHLYAVATDDGKSARRATHSWTLATHSWTCDDT